MAKKLTTEEFVEKAVAVHGSRYSYSVLAYVNALTKVEIVCDKHGSFWQKPSSHLSKGCGCPKCSGRMPLTSEELISRCTRIHKGKYTYDRAIYTSASANFTATCPTHGDFETTPNRHQKQKGGGCPSCSTIRRHTTEEFVEKALSVHGRKFSYTDSVYLGDGIKLEISCTKGHKNFWQTPSNHLGNRRGCPTCSKNSVPTTLEFVEKCNVVHDGKFSYVNTVYTGSNSKIIVTCKTHGDFKMRASAHGDGQGCPNCKGGGYRSSIAGLFYVLSDGELTKIGITNRTVALRVKEIRKDSGKDFQVQLCINFKDGAIPLSLETEVLKLLRTTHKRPKLSFDGSTESFYAVDPNQLLMLIDEQVNKILNYEDNVNYLITYQESEPNNV